MHQQLPNSQSERLTLFKLFPSSITCYSAPTAAKWSKEFCGWGPSRKPLRSNSRKRKTKLFVQIIRRGKIFPLTKKCQFFSLLIFDGTKNSRKKTKSEFWKKFSGKRILKLKMYHSVIVAVGGLISFFIVLLPCKLFFEKIEILI